MLSIYVIKIGHVKDEEFYGSLADEDYDLLVKEPGIDESLRLERLQQGIAKVDPFKEIRCSSFREQFYKSWRSEGIPDNSSKLGDWDWRAIDFMFCAPKSASMVVYLEEDLRVLEAHQEVVKDCMKVIEERFAATRIDNSKSSKVVHTGNLIIALFYHAATRYGEMEVHTHALVMNRTKGPDKQWQPLCLQRLLEAKWVGRLYLNQLACKLQGLGYRVYETEQGFEIKGYTQKDIQAMSQRSGAILRQLNKGKGFK